ncbi:pyridine nucleotide-disulfide oxidoreductase [Arthrobacter sp. JZ12]|uniref:NAD(P)/FAD-dependent oxidoreductase n=1 Tax=Arthrobacter sp. JZ12 TaxID=2654190 RepID=UPI002B49DA3B|nr:FAD/NAD(P)-binding oxidoreductase [Arthrobacter sp. JZ12]WRH24145.1 pyridine nucleotide-disulfide oxidoreductase [Arthrobacter sp. JZ12]
MAESNDYKQQPDHQQPEHHQVLIIGGGNAGISLAARLKRYRVKGIAIVDPTEQHLYQPFFSHIAGGTAKAESAVRSQASVMPKGVTWVKDAATAIDPERKVVTLASGRQATYEHLVVCPGIQKNWDQIPGLKDAFDSPYAATNYSLDLAVKAWRLLSSLRSGTAIFTVPDGPITCGGAAQKPMYLACDYWRSQGVLDDIRVILAVPTETIYGVGIIDEELNRKIAEYGVELRCTTELASVDAENRVATLRNTAQGTDEHIPYDVLHATPPQSAPDWLRETGLANDDGFVAVDKKTLRHITYPTVWSLGDAAGTANSKSGAALRKQTKVLAKNLKAVLGGGKPGQEYNGYGACPFTVTRHTVVLAEYDDTRTPKPSVPGWKGLAREKRLTWWVERYGFIRLYWYFILKGRA